jgi:hypothetical protein
VLAALHSLLRPGGLFYYGVYGGFSFEGVWPEDKHEPKRYFVFYTDAELQRRVADLFDIVTFQRVVIEGEREGHFQSLILRSKESV